MTGLSACRLLRDLFRLIVALSGPVRNYAVISYVYISFIPGAGCLFICKYARLSLFALQ